MPLGGHQPYACGADLGFLGFDVFSRHAYTAARVTGCARRLRRMVEDGRIELVGRGSTGGRMPIQW